MADGWIKLHRKFLEHWLCDEYRPLTKREAWENMLLWANYLNDKVLIKGSIIECNRGQICYSLETWSKKFNWSVSQVRQFFKLLESDKMIKVEGLKYTTRLTICNYEEYQDYIQTDNKLTTNSPQTDDILPATSKEVKKDKKEKNIGDNTIEKRMDDFISEMKNFEKTYPAEMCVEFYNYWSEPNKNRTKMRKELEKTWDTSRRLNTWFNRSKFNK